MTDTEAMTEQELKEIETRENELAALHQGAFKTKTDVAKLIQEVRRLRLLIRCETIKPPYEVTDDLTTELAVENSDLRAVVNQMQDWLKCYADHRPGCHYRSLTNGKMDAPTCTCGYWELVNSGPV